MISATSQLPAPAVRFLPLPPQALETLLAGDLAAARTITGVQLSDWFLSEEVTWLWRMRLDQITLDPKAADSEKSSATPRRYDQLPVTSAGPLSSADRLRQPDHPPQPDCPKGHRFGAKSPNRHSDPMGR